MKLLNGCTEGNRCERSQLEALFAEGDADDGDAPEDACKKVGNCKTDAAQEEPDDVGDRVLAEVSGNRFAEGPKSECSQLKCLLAEGNTDDGNTPNKTDEEPSDCGAESRKEEPKNVCDRFHKNVS